MTSPLHIFLFITLSLAACAHPDHFPPRTLDPTSDRDGFYDEWYSKHLVALREPSLVAKAADRRAHVVRALILPTFSGPISLRLIVHRRGGVLVLRKAGGMAGYEPGRLRVARRVVLTRRQVARVLGLLAQMDFWIAGPRMGYFMGHDATMVVLEAVRDGRHHIVHDTYDAELAQVAGLLYRYARLRR